MEDGMDTACEFKSPLRKLVPHFKKSRDQWKQKCQNWKRRCLALSSQVRAVEASRDRWKALAKEQRQEVQRLTRQLEAVKTPPRPIPRKPTKGSSPLT